MLTISSAVLNVLTRSLMLLGSLLGVSGLRTSNSVRKAMKLWDITADSRFWKVQLDVRDLGRHLDFIRSSVLQSQGGYCWCGYCGCLASWFSGQVGVGSR